MRIIHADQLEGTIPASPRAKRLPQGSIHPLPLRQVRRELNLTEGELAKQAALSESELRRLEANDLPDVHALVAYARALGGELQVTIAFGEKSYRLELTQVPPADSGTDLTAGWSDADDPFPESAHLLANGVQVRRA